VDDLRNLGCRFGQGFAISRPLPPDDLADWMAQRSAGPLVSDRPSRGVPSGRRS
jgi:sensor c-di-GMP phosphodiesterase-like protein